MCSEAGNRGGRGRPKENVQVWIVMEILNQVPPFKFNCLLVINRDVWLYSNLATHSESGSQVIKIIFKCIFAN